MNFFRSQDLARRNTLLLIGLFSLAVLCLIVLTNLLVAGLLWYADEPFVGGYTHAVHSAELNNAPPEPMTFLRYLHWETVALISAVVISTVAVVSCFKLVTLASSGRNVAEAMGGQLISQDTRDPDERRLLNVVEEMAIASGTPVPPVYVMQEETGINAFAAGYTPADAVIAVTRGTLTLLDRDQLQGVIGHEFSHVLNGDMRLNLRLIAVLAGILFIGQAGSFILRSSAYRRHYRHSSSRSSGNPLPLILFGLGLLVIGYAGVFFGNLIKAAISRQRELLADASSVQFTRNPQGLAEALKLIGGHRDGALIEKPAASEISHMFFGQALRGGMMNLFDTHPPLEDRIQRIDPRWDGEFLQPDVSALAPAEASEPAPATTPTGASALAPAAAAVAAGAGATTADDTTVDDATVDDAIEQTGQPTPDHVDRARQLIATIPESVRDAAHNTFAARSVIYALLLDADESGRIRARQIRLLEQDDPQLATLAAELDPAIKALDPAARLPLVDMTVPALKAMSTTQYTRFRQQMVRLAQADGHIDLFEWVLYRLMVHNLGSNFENTRPPEPRYRRVKPLADACQTVLSFLAHQEHGTPEAAEQAYQAGAEVAGITLPLLPASEIDLARFGKALNKMARAYPLLKPRLLKAAAATIRADQRTSVVELELLRAIAAILDCPMPPQAVPTPTP